MNRFTFKYDKYGIKHIFVDAAYKQQAWPTFIIPETRERLARRTRRGSRVIKEGPRNLHLQSSITGRETDPDGVMIHRIAVPRVLDQKLHLG